jgi:NADPH2:quinone reductase
MQYIDLENAGGPEVMHLAEGPAPQPAAGEVLIRVLAAGVNQADVMQRQGRYPPPRGASPVLGLEVAGEVAAVGAGALGWRVGERVCALVNGGGYAEYCAAPVVQCLPWPKGYDAVRAAALPEACFTVWANLFELGRLASGESVLVHGGTSGIGVAAIQLAREFGATVYATAGSDAKCAACLRLGAAAAIEYTREDFAERIGVLTHERGVDVVLDIVGAPYFERNLRALAFDGRLVEVATQGGSVVERVDLLQLMRRRLVVTGSTMRPRTSAEKALIARALHARVWPVLDAGRCAPIVHAVFPLGAAAEAHRLMESGAHIGKIVLRAAP